MFKGLTERLGLYAENILEGAIYKAQKRLEEEKEQREIREFKEKALRKIRFYNSILLDKPGTAKFEDELEKELVSLRFGEDSVLYYRISEKERKEIDEILDLSFEEKYKEAKEKIKKLMGENKL